MSVRRQLIVRSMDLPLYRMYRAVRVPVLPPLQITLAVTYRCKYRCPTCRCRENTAAPELTDQEYYKFFHALKFRPFLMTITGGEPMVRNDILKITALMGQLARPQIACIETAGVMPDRLYRCMRLLTERYRDTHFVVMLSLPGVHARLDELRGAPPRTGAFETFLKTYRALRSISAPNYSVGVNVLLSRFNAADAGAVMDYAFLMYPDLVKLTVAHASAELGVAGPDVAPPRKEHDDLVARYIQKSAHTGGRSVHRVFWSVLRAQSRLAARNLHLMAQATPCHAAHGSIYITPDGRVLDCPAAAREISGLRENAFDLDRILTSDRAHITRKLVAANDCFCPMDCSDFTHALLHVPTYLKMTTGSF